MTETLVEYACSNQVATLTLNRPDRLNAFSDDLVRQLADALRRFDLDPEAQVAIICGKGRAFSSGADVHQRQLRKREEFEEHGGPQGWGANSADLFAREVIMQTAPLKLYLSEDFHEAARAFAEKRKPGPFKGR